MTYKLRSALFFALAGFVATSGLLHTRATEAEGPAKTLPDFVNWSYDGAYQTHNGLRSAITLNGWWRWMHCYGSYGTEAPTEASAWFYRKVPGYGATYRIRKADGKNANPRKDIPDVPPDKMRRLTQTTAWVEREFTVPAEWKDRDVEIVFDNNSGESEVHLDGKMMGFTWGFRSHAMPLAKPYKTGAAYKLSVRTGGVVNNVWLRSYEPTGYRIKDSYLTTSFREMSCTIRAAGSGKPDAKARVVITEYNQPDKVVKTSAPLPVRADGKGWKIEARFPWKDPKLWTTVTPNLYSYHLELADAAGKVVDRIFPIRFGFRELWIEGGSFMLNDHRISLTMDLHSALGRSASKYPIGRYSNEEYTKKILHRWKDMGVYCAILRTTANLDDSELFRVADEIGFFIGIDTPGLRYEDPEFMKDPEIRQSILDRFAAMILPRRHSPSVAYYHLANTHHDPPTYDYTPSMLGEDFDKAELAGKDPIAEERALVKSLDPVRIAFAGSGGGKYEPVHSSMNYISVDADMQVHETWPSRWYKHQKKPLALNEMEVPSFQKNWFKRTSRGKQTSFPLFMETAAIHLGEAPYKNEPKANIATWFDENARNNVGLTRSWSHQVTTDLFVEKVFRSWRTYGVNMGFWCMFVRYFENPRMVIPALDVDPRRPDPTMDTGASIWHWPVGPMTREGALAKKGLAPLLAYIGGPDGEFAAKDRSFHSGERIRKAVVVVNDMELGANLGGRWELAATAGKKVTGGRLPGTRFGPGELAPAKIHIEFKAPRVKQRTDFLLKLQAKADREGHLTDTFAITVFPKAEPPAIPQKMKLYLYDPIGDTRRMLDQTGLEYKMLAVTLPPPQNSLLIVGRNALRDEANRKRLKSFLRVEMTYDLRVNTSNGMRVLVFEQAMDNIWGLNTEQTRWRRSFVTAAGHPALEGLTTADFHYLRGDASLVEPYPGPHAKDLGRLAVDRYPDWGNDNTVVTYAITRPQRGACRSLLSCGFDLQESALLEYAAGQGRMMFCQIDVHGRYGKDPVSTRLVNNILAYMTAAPEPVIDKTIDLVREGWEDYDIDVKKETIFMADRPPGPISWGITLADLYFQGNLELPVIQAADGKKYLYAKLEGEKALAHMLNRRTFKTRWQKMKAMQIRAALLINQGGSSDYYPNPFIQGDDETLYPMEWLEGFVHPYTMMQW